MRVKDDDDDTSVVDSVYYLVCLIFASLLYLLYPLSSGSTTHDSIQPCRRVQHEEKLERHGVLVDTSKNDKSIDASSVVHANHDFPLPSDTSS